MSQERIRESDCKVDDTFIIIETLRDENTTLTHENISLMRENSRLAEENSSLKNARVKDAEHAVQLQGKISELEETMRFVQQSMPKRTTQSVQDDASLQSKDDPSSRSKDSGAETDSSFSGGRPSGSTSQLGSPVAVTSASKRPRYLSSTSSAASLHMSLHSDVTGPRKCEPPPFSTDPLPPPPASSVSNILFPTTSSAATSSKSEVPPNASQSKQQPVEMKPAPPDDDDDGAIVLDSEEEEDDIIIVPSGGKIVNF